MIELSFGVLFAFGLAFALVCLLGYWHVSDKLWRVEMRCVILEHWCDNLANNLVRLTAHVEQLTQCHNNFVRDVQNGNVQPPPSDLNEADWWKEENGRPPWENN